MWDKFLIAHEILILYLLGKIYMVIVTDKIPISRYQCDTFEMYVSYDIGSK